MKNFKLKALGLEEMSINEMKNLKGGNWWMVFRGGNNLWGIDLPFNPPHQVHGTPGNYYTIHKSIN